MKCNVCKKNYSPSCDYKQGRCPLHPPMMSKPCPAWLLFLMAPFVIGAWTITHPKQVWAQAKKDWKL